SNLGTPMQWLQRLIYDLEPIATQLGTDSALALATSVLETNGAELQLAEWQPRPDFVPAAIASKSTWASRSTELALVASVSGLSGLLAGIFGL
ncbi:MAG: hypothetical protein AAF483_29225, partial [Planctomycetota bacterium]